MYLQSANSPLALGTLNGYAMSFYTNGTLAASFDTSQNLNMSTGQIRGNASGVPPLLADSAGNTASCRAWVNFNGNSGASPVINASFNVSSVTRNSTGNYTLAFASNMPDVNYAVNFGVCSGGAGYNSGFVGCVLSATQYGAPSNKTTSVCQVAFSDYTATLRDFTQLYVSVFR